MAGPRRPDGRSAKLRCRLAQSWFPAARGLRKATGRARMKKKETGMRTRTILAVVVAMTASAAMADELDDAHRLAVSGRDSYWNCLAREYQR